MVNGNTLDLVRSDSTHTDLTFDRDYTTADFSVAASGGNTVITTDTVTAGGTWLDTKDGPVAVEDLNIGDKVLTASGPARSVRWIGRRHLNLTRHPASSPVRSMPACRAATCWFPRTTRCCGTDCSSRLLAEGAPAESYLDTGNRNMFDNADLTVMLHPDMSDGQVRREAESCAPFAADAKRVKPIWQRLPQRAPLLGLTAPEPIETTSDPELRVEVAGTSSCCQSGSAPCGYGRATRCRAMVILGSTISGSWAGRRCG